MLIVVGLWRLCWARRPSLYVTLHKVDCYLHTLSTVQSHVPVPLIQCTLNTNNYLGNLSYTWFSTLLHTESRKVALKKSSLRSVYPRNKNLYHAYIIGMYILAAYYMQ